MIYNIQFGGFSIVHIYTYEAKRHGPAYGLQAGSLVTFYTGPSCRPSPRAGRAPFAADALQGGEPGKEDLSVRPPQPD